MKFSIYLNRRVFVMRSNNHRKYIHVISEAPHLPLLLPSPAKLVASLFLISAGFKNYMLMETEKAIIRVRGCTGLDLTVPVRTWHTAGFTVYLFY